MDEERHRLVRANPHGFLWHSNRTSVLEFLRQDTYQSNYAAPYMVLQAWRRIAHRAGVSTAGEPAMDRLWNTAPTNCEDRGDILDVLPSGRVVADVSVVHPAATSYSRAAARNAGAAAASRDALKRRQYHAGGLPAALSFSPLSVESYGRFGVSAMQFLHALAEAALASSAAGTDVTKAALRARSNIVYGE
jgi:hypothetical protein